MDGTTFWLGSSRGGSGSSRFFGELAHGGDGLNHHVLFFSQIKGQIITQIFVNRIKGCAGQSRVGFFRLIAAGQGFVLQHNIGVVIGHIFEVTQRNIKEQTQIAGNALEIPNVNDRGRQFDMAHAVTAYFRLRHFDAAALADNAAMADALVFTAIAFPIF